MAGHGVDVGGARYERKRPAARRAFCLVNLPKLDSIKLDSRDTKGNNRTSREFNSDHSNVFLGIGVFVGASLLCVFFAALIGSTTAGEVAGALGSFIGGIIGAGGAVLAVYLALSNQRREETAKVSVSVRTEVAALSKYVIGAIEICRTITNGTRQVPI